MTNLTMNRDVPVRMQSHADGTAVRYGRALWVVRCWQWMLATSQVAVDHHYAAPWKRDADRSQTPRTQAKG